MDAFFVLWATVFSATRFFHASNENLRYPCTYHSGSFALTFCNDLLRCRFLFCFGVIKIRRTA